jgi:PPOX class probable F420-dependent enzyme
VQSSIAHRLDTARVGRLATIGSDGRPHVVSCCFALHGAVLYSAVDAKPKSSFKLRRISNIRANRLAALLVDDYFEDWSLLWWIRVDGTARVIESGTEYDQAIELLVAKYQQYRHQRPPGPVIAIDITSWRAWPSPESRPGSS